MPNYASSIIYKLCCSDAIITDIYIGSTTNFVKRKQQHKQGCNNPSAVGYNLNVYQFIRANGGWESWNMVEVERFNAIDKRNLLTRERYWLETLKASLNRVIPSRTQQEYRIENKTERAEKQKQYYIDNKQEIASYNKQYRNDNKENIKQYYTDNKTEIASYNKQYNIDNKKKINEKSKQYYIDNKQEIAEKKKQFYINNKQEKSEKAKQYYIENKQELSDYKKQKITCLCGAVTRKGDKAKHMRSKKCGFAHNLHTFIYS